MVSNKLSSHSRYSYYFKFKITISNPKLMNAQVTLSAIQMKDNTNPLLTI